MDKTNYICLDTSVLYRANQRYYDELLTKYDLTFAHLIFLIEIYEEEGITMNVLTEKTFFDKGSVSKSIKKLEDQGYVTIATSQDDRRAKQLYTTEKARSIMIDLYQMRQDRWNYLTEGLSEDAKESYLNISDYLTNRAREYDTLHHVNNQATFYGLQKCTLLDYPGLVAATLFTGGCNFRCPYCHNRPLVFLSENDSTIDNDYLWDFFEKRKNILDGVCISGGEPLLTNGLKAFIIKLKSLGLKIKLDTNGSQFEALKDLIEEGLLDYVAMDIKNAQAKYPMTVGIKEVPMEDIQNSVAYLLEGHVPYEFRTTIVQEFHEADDLKAIGEWIKGAEHYYLQYYTDRDTVIQKGLHAVDQETMETYRKIAEGYVKEAIIRGGL